MPAFGGRLVRVDDEAGTTIFRGGTLHESTAKVFSINGKGLTLTCMPRSIASDPGRASGVER
jgi:hypothetical protein